MTKTMIERIEKTVIFIMTVFLFVFTVASLTIMTKLYNENKKLLIDNEHLRVINSTTAKTKHFIGVDDALEMSRILPAAEMFIVDPKLMLAIRKTENGRHLLEFGCHSVNARIRRDKSISPADYQYYESAFTIALSQRAFVKLHKNAFVEFLAQSYCPKNKAFWIRNIYENFAKDDAKLDASKKSRIK